jgi:tetratricopeptide (TPR) repeat protein
MELRAAPMTAWIARGRRPPALQWIAVLVVTVLLARWLLLNGMAIALDKTSPRSALLWQAEDPEALVRVNEREGDVLAKAQRAREVLRLRPLDGRAYRQIAETRAAAGQMEAARALYRIALRRSPRDRLSNAWLIDDALTHGRVTEALGQIDVLLRIDGVLRPPLFAYLAAQAAHPDFRQALVRTLVNRPSWADEFLLAWANQSGSSRDLDSVCSALLAANGSLDGSVRSAWIASLVRDQRWVDAWKAWTAAPGGETASRTDAVSDGGFDHDLAGPFGWMIESSEGASIDRVAPPGNDGNAALRLEFFDQRVDLKPVTQLRVLSPGRYRFASKVRLEALQTERGLRWSVACVQSPDRPLGSSGLLRGEQSWTTVQFEFTVPSGCPAQRIALELDARTAMEHRISGVAWVDDVSLQKLDNGDSAFDQAAPPAEVAVARPIDTEALPVAGRGSHDGLTVLEIVRQVVGSQDNAAGNPDPDVPVAP